MIGIIDDIWKNAPIETPFGKIPTLNFEVNGDLLQACSRLFWFTGDRKYLDWAIRLGDYYLLGTNHPDARHEAAPPQRPRLRGHQRPVRTLRRRARTPRRRRRRPTRSRCTRCSTASWRSAATSTACSTPWFNPQTGEHSTRPDATPGATTTTASTPLCLIDGTAAYRDAVRKALGNLKGNYAGSLLGQSKSADGYADSIEGAINLFNREPVAVGGRVDRQPRSG